MAPDTTFNLGEFSYYPSFLRAFKEKYLYEKEDTLNKRDRERRLRFIRDEEIKIDRMIDTSQTLPASLKNYYRVACPGRAASQAGITKQVGFYVKNVESFFIPQSTIPALTTREGYNPIMLSMNPIDLKSFLMSR